VLRPAPPDEAIHPLIAGRWSSRAIDESKEVDFDVMKRLFEAARWAPSAMNNQPWRFLAFGPEDMGALNLARSALTAGNSWALAAPRLLFVAARSDRPKSGSPNPRAGYEAGMAAFAMALQAAEEGLVFHQMAGFDPETVRREFNVPDNYQIITAVAVGRPGPAESLAEKHLVQESGERIRKPLAEIVFTDGGAPAKDDE
jgi:nitroreductase